MPGIPEGGQSSCDLFALRTCICNGRGRLPFGKIFLRECNSLTTAKATGSMFDKTVQGHLYAASLLPCCVVFGKLPNARSCTNECGIPDANLTRCWNSLPKQVNDHACASKSNQQFKFSLTYAVLPSAAYVLRSMLVLMLVGGLSHTIQKGCDDISNEFNFSSDRFTRASLEQQNIPP